MTIRSRLVAFTCPAAVAAAVLFASAGDIEARAGKLNSGVKGAPGGTATAPPNKVVRDHRKPWAPPPYPGAGGKGCKYNCQVKVRDHRTKVIVRDHRGKHRPAGQTK